MNIYDDLTLIIVTYRSETLIVKNLAILKKFKVIIIDNSNSDKLQLIINDYNNINLIKSSKNLGYGKAVNLGISQSNTYFVLTVSPDILLNESSIEILFSTFVNDINNIGLLGPSLYDSNMKRRTNGTISYIKKLKGNKIFNTINNMPEGNICCDYLVGCCYLIKRDFFNSIGGFDEDFFMYFEDNDLCDKILLNNKLIMEVPSSKLIHLENSSTEKKKFTNIKLSIIHKISSYIYIKKKTNFIFLTFKILTNFIDYSQRFIINLLFFNLKKTFKNLLRIISIILYLTKSYKLVYRLWKM
jgi:GT2 family glycosyltransferase